MSKNRILVIEDESDIRELIVLHLERAGYLVDSAPAAEDGAEFLRRNQYDLLVLDWMLPGQNGPQFASELRKKSETKNLSILMVTAKASADDIVSGLEAGADDYLTKPFEPAVLIARVQALLRRNLHASASGSKEIKNAEVRLGELVMNSETYEVRCGPQPISLTPSEFKLLFALGNNKGRVLTRNSLIDLIQGEGVSVVGRTVDTHVFGLRKKLGDCADVIETVRGIGYRVKATT